MSQVTALAPAGGAQFLAQVLTLLLVSREQVTVIVTTSDGCRAEIPIRQGDHFAPPAPVAQTTLPCGWRPLSGIEARIVAAADELTGGGIGWTTIGELAQTIGEKPSPEFRCLVRNLADDDVGILETSTRYGVRLRRNWSAAAPDSHASHNGSS